MYLYYLYAVLTLIGTTLVAIAFITNSMEFNITGMMIASVFCVLTLRDIKKHERLGD